MMIHIVRNSFWIKKNQARDNEGKFHAYLKCRNWICIQKFNFHWTSELAWIWHLLHWQHFDKTYFKLMVVQLFLKTQKRQFCNQTLPEQERLKSANCSQKMPNHINFDVQEKNRILFYKFKFYNSSMYEICLYCHLLSFSCFRMNYVQCEGLP